MATIKIESGRVARLSALAIGLILLGNLAAIVSIHWLDHDYALGLVPLFYMDAENNVPTLFSVLLMVCISGLLLLAGYLQKEGRLERFRWYFLAAIFIFLAVDEFASLHEKLTIPLRNSLDVGGALYFAWIIPYLLFVIVLGIIYSPWLLRLNRRVSSWMVLSAAIYLAGAIGMEAVGGWYLETNNEQRDILWSFLITLEELMEMAGLTVFIYAILRYLELDPGLVRLQVGKDSAGLE